MGLVCLLESLPGSERFFKNTFKIHMKPWKSLDVQHPSAIIKKTYAQKTKLES